MENNKSRKPLNGKAYGSIGHMATSRVGPGDWHIHEGQEKILTQKPRKGDIIIVQEKLDGSCMAVAKINGEIVPLTRKGHLPETTTFEHLQQFAPWVNENRRRFDELLNEGERVCGEWLTMAHGTLYDRHHSRFRPFIPFDIFRENKRILFAEFVVRIHDAGFIYPNGLHMGPEPFSVEDAKSELGEYGFHGAMEPCEGAVWRVEREGRVDFLAKWVRPDKVDGKYFPQISGNPPIWNFKIG